LSQRQCTPQLTGGCLGAKVESNFNVMEMMLLCLLIINVYPYRYVANVIKYLFTEVLHEFSKTEWESSEPLPKSVAILFRFRLLKICNIYV